MPTKKKQGRGRNPGPSRGSGGLRLVLVEWVDSHSGRDGWRDFEALEKSCVPLLCQSVGWIVAEKNSCITLVPHKYNPENGSIVFQGAGDMVIPKQAVLKMTVLQGP